MMKEGSEMNSSYDAEVDAYYFEDRDSNGRSVRQVPLGTREVYADIDINGRIIGIELL